MFNPRDLDAYVKEVVDMGMLDEEIESIKTMMANLVKYPRNTPQEQTITSARMTQLFKALLLAKDLRQKSVDKVGKNDSSNTKNGGTGPTYNS